MKKSIAIITIVLIMAVLSACSPVDLLLDPIAPQPDDFVPARMVASIEVSSHPEDPDLIRSYTDAETVTTVLRQLKDLETNEPPKNEPKLDEEDNYVAFTVKYANSQSETYCLLEKQYLRDSNGDWHIVDRALAIEFLSSIENTPNG